MISDKDRTKMGRRVKTKFGNRDIDRYTRFQDIYLEFVLNDIILLL